MQAAQAVQLPPKAIKISFKNKQDHTIYKLQNKAHTENEEKKAMHLQTNPICAATRAHAKGGPRA